MSLSYKLVIFLRRVGDSPATLTRYPLVRSGHRLAARSAELARSGVLISTFSRNDARLGRHLAVLADHCGG
jgi:hypothetical protein